MKCRLHYSIDPTSTIGVCASCLRERLFILISTQSQFHHHLHNDAQSQVLDDRRNSDPYHHHQQHPLTFPRSVSPYVTGHKFNDDFTLDFSNQKFHSTPQIGGASTEKKLKKKKNKFSFITNLFKSKSDKSQFDPRTADNKSKPVTNFVSERVQSQNTQNRTQTRSKVSDRGMSPDCDEEEEEETSSRSSESYEPTWKQTPVSTSSGVSQGMRRRHSNMSGLAFCLSPLVRASPNRNWNWNRNSLPIERGGCGDGVRKVVAANSFGKNRSKKMADFGRGGGGGFDHRR